MNRAWELGNTVLPSESLKSVLFHAVSTLCEWVWRTFHGELHSCFLNLRSSLCFLQIDPSVFFDEKHRVALIDIESVLDLIRKSNPARFHDPRAVYESRHFIYNNVDIY